MDSIRSLCHHSEGDGNEPDSCAAVVSDQSGYNGQPARKGKYEKKETTKTKTKKKRKS